METDDKLSSSEIEAIRAGLNALEKGKVTFFRAEEIERLFSQGLQERVLREAAAKYLPTPAAPPRINWDIGFSDGFIKDIEDIDGKLRGRVMNAITSISREPTIVRGDTVRPLVEDLKGLWRYRISNFRLIYRPEPEKRRVLLMTLENRGDVYKH